MVKEREVTPKGLTFSDQYQELKRFLQESGQIHFRDESGVADCELNPKRFITRYPKFKEIIAVRQSGSFTNGDQHVIELGQTILLSPTKAFRLIILPARNDFTLLAPRGRDIDLTRSHRKTLRLLVEERVFNLNGAFDVSSLPLSPQPAIIS